MGNYAMKDLKIVGDGSYPGGNYEKVAIIGNGIVSGDVTAGEGKFTGSCAVQGNASFEIFRMVGQGDIDGDLISEEVKVAGELNVKSIRSELLKIKGFLNSSGNIEVEEMNVKGGFDIKGSLNVGQLSVNLQIAPSTVTEIGGEEITIKSRGLLNRTYRLEAELIEGDSIYLEYTTAKVVRGNDIELGPGCQIGLVEYRENFENKDSKVGDAKKI
ncbi:hypothetical protein EKG37_04200 [Robertmurraya yapensis]|uniref:Cytoplasmic protein n=2 Tax=Bacillaceae TaxID=186817 RepID=A0A3S0RTD8_9BACI|nr:hypothetical protein [Bacillus yapensis]RTR35839.1 hypothetical protein EKG37_04200 [Bacillus yapensis]TKS98641.1 hypothetical protein FAR12_04200 [Bacillus yapensis]